MNAEQLQRVIDDLREPTPPPLLAPVALMLIVAALTFLASLILAAGS